MTAARSILVELEDAIATGTSEKRVETLRRVTDLFMVGAGSYSEEQVSVFDSVIVRLAADIEARARAELAERLAKVANAPLLVMKNLAADDITDVAAPVLTHSSRLDDETLVGIAERKGQDHLLAISNRDSISELVTDILVTRGDQQVVRTVAQNAGARFSDTGFGILVKRSEGDDVLASHLGVRKDMPKHHLAKLVESASDAVRRKLAAANPLAAMEIRRVLAELAAKVKAEVGATPPRDYTAAKAKITEMRSAGKFGEAEVRVFAQLGKFEETVAGLSFLCGLPIDVVENTFQNDNSDMSLVVARAVGFSWPTAEQNSADAVHGRKPVRTRPGERQGQFREAATRNRAAGRAVLSGAQERRPIARRHNARRPLLYLSAKGSFAASAIATESSSDQLSTSWISLASSSWSEGHTSTRLML